MGQKVHPVGLRLGIIRDHRSRWFAKAGEYPALLSEDHKIRKYIEKKLASSGIAEIDIERKADQVEITIRTARPGVVVGRGGSGIDELRASLEKLLGRRQIRINVADVQRVDAEAGLLAEYIAGQLERRVAFRRAVRQAIQRAQRAGVQGIKVAVSGRLNGAEIARSEWTREGRIPLHTLRADIDYAYRIAQTTYGTLGVKVWIFRGEILPGSTTAAPEETVQAPKPDQRPQRRKKIQYEERTEE
ncbi:30S ribosomal protein S3 [Gloeobacter kilaueensis]|uniref:Small ribosomal subunit protein uS3 n=1 Tax=Gloeobacter kilaueensis (strain ATCC BAA-2537 / CCAP 1431/1 / ULC 316 / JS1) TaxID=1183438 RepID=U5QJ48_GLOK1|nr:30S ribosomal protein S3 [Gloeobacter kilaueensis]AGY58883.1 30S ribosomal protein S3 [Gloeobacter kilaueensis JS1]